MTKSDCYHSAQLSVSTPTLQCEDIVQSLLRGGIMASVAQNRSIVCDAAQRCRVENGCRILFNRVSRDELQDTWQMLRDQHALECAHISIPTIYTGCIWDFLKPSACPWERLSFSTPPCK